MNNRWMFTIAMMLGSAVTGAQPSPSAPRVLYAMRILVSVDGVQTSTAEIVSPPGVSDHVSALLGPDAEKSPRFQIDASADEVQQASGSSAVMMKLTLSKPDSNGGMQVFATPVVVAAEGQISYVQVGDITLSVWVTRTHTPSAADRAAAAAADRMPESPAQEPPPPAVRLGIVYDTNPTGQSKPLPGGALVARVESGSVAERAGLLPGDRIVRFDDHDIRGPDLQTIMATKKPGDTATMVVIRNGVERPLVAQF
jgi:hypothetical protein